MESEIEEACLSVLKENDSLSKHFHSMLMRESYADLSLDEFKQDITGMYGSVLEATKLPRSFYNYACLLSALVAIFEELANRYRHNAAVIKDVRAYIDSLVNPLLVNDSVIAKNFIADMLNKVEEYYSSANADRGVIDKVLRQAETLAKLAEDRLESVDKFCKSQEKIGFNDVEEESLDAPARPAR
ncbi:MAG TPA: hypothetical protein VNC84_01495 [Gammaproteobacteria bacterium]|nr:hypothetical protein [Gammaproteobacteria bacterium]